MTDLVGMKTRVCKTGETKIKPAFLCEKEVATYLGVSDNLLRKCRGKGTGPVWHKFEGCIRYPIAELEEYIARARQDFTGQHANANREINAPFV